MGGKRTIRGCKSKVADRRSENEFARDSKHRVENMSLDKVDQLIKELEAIKNYDKVKKERDEAVTRIAEQQAELALKEKSITRALEEQKTMKQKLNEKEDRIKALENEIKTKDDESQKLKSQDEELKARAKELEELKATTEGKALKDAEIAFLRAKEEETKREAEKLFQDMKKSWGSSEKPKEVLNEAIRWLKLTVEGLARPGSALFLKEVVEAGLPEKVEEILRSEVQRRLDVEFTSRVEARAQQVADEKLNYLKSVEWPAWQQTNVMPKIIELESKILTGAIRALRGPWKITCERCGSQQSVELTAEGVRGLLAQGHVLIDCTNPNCTDAVLFRTVRHKIRVQCKDLIEGLLKI